MTPGHKRQNYEDRQDLAGEYRWGDAGQLLFLVVFIIILFSDLFLIKLSNFWQNTVPWYFRVILFIPLFIISGYLARTGLKQVFEEERKELEVINSGVFGIVRHPIYLGSIILFLSFVILSLSILALIIWFAIVIFYYYLCRYEEKLLIKKLGDKYLDYIKEVPMLIPIRGGK